MLTLSIKTQTAYDIYIANDLLNTQLLADFCLSLSKRLIIITDHRVAKRYGQTLLQQLTNAEMIEFPPGEYYKTRETKQQLEDALLERGCGRDTAIIALGGGVVTDMAGFIASTYCRGIPAIYIPTTFLAMVDAAIGGKTGVNTPLGKNLIGSFSQPLAVFIDPMVLASLPDDAFNDGLVESLKHGLIYDAQFFQQFTSLPTKTGPALTNLIHRSCEIKGQVIERDPHEHGIRQILNFGHTVGHALETLLNYRISHGQAVLLGMQVECQLSYLAGYLSAADNQSIQSVLSQIHYSTTVTFTANQMLPLIKLMQLDKKSLQQQAHFVLLTGIGQVYCPENIYSYPVNQATLEEALSLLL